MVVAEVTVPGVTVFIYDRMGAVDLALDDGGIITVGAPLGKLKSALQESIV